MVNVRSIALIAIDCSAAWCSVDRVCACVRCVVLQQVMCMHARVMCSALCVQFCITTRLMCLVVRICCKETIWFTTRLMCCGCGAIGLCCNDFACACVRTGIGRLEECMCGRRAVQSRATHQIREPLGDLAVDLSSPLAHLELLQARCIGCVLDRSSAAPPLAVGTI